MNVGILGSGPVARALGAGFWRYRHDVMLGTRDPAALAQWAAGHPGARAGDPAQAAAFGELLVLAVKGQVAGKALQAVDPEHLAGKPVIDTTNPIADAPPVDGVISFFTGPNESLLEQLQAQVPEARLVKAFNSVGNQHMVDPAFAGGPPTMFTCGDDDAAKQTVRGVLEEFGWEVADMGGVAAARAIEPLCVLWCIPAIRDGRSDHVFKLLRPTG